MLARGAQQVCNPMFCVLAHFFFLVLIYHLEFQVLYDNHQLFCCNQTNWLDAVIAGLLENAKQAQEWKQVEEFDKERVLSVPQGNYVELKFTMRSQFPRPCLFGEYLEIRDGSNQSANLLGKFCGEEYGNGVVRSRGRYMWLKFISADHYDFTAFYSGRLYNETGM